MAKISAAEQLRMDIAQLHGMVATRDEIIAKLEKELASAKSNGSSYLAGLSDLRREVEAVHVLLDAMSNPPPRKAPDSYSEFPIMTRLAVWLASRQHNNGGF